jgi:hypothetical protein
MRQSEQPELPGNERIRALSARDREGSVGLMTKPFIAGPVFTLKKFAKAFLRLVSTGGPPALF